jgi:restriction system protein
MSVPDFQTIMLPLLDFMKDGKEHSIHEVVASLAKFFNLSDQNLNELLPVGRQTRFYNRVGWARTYLVKAGLLTMSRRSFYQITNRGKEVLKEKPSRIDMKFLQRYPEYIEFKKRRETTIDKPEKIIDDNRTPEETLEDAYQEIREDLAQEILHQVKSCSPAFFERLVVELLVKMGYGGSRIDAARAVGQSGDGGIDEDRLGLDSIYIQAKRWESSVGRPEIQKFVGALIGKRAKKGIFITTASFTQDAHHYVSNIDSKVVLIDGEKLAEFMIDYDIGVTEVISYKLKRIDSDYFTEG